MTLNTTILKISLSFRTREMSTLHIMTTTPAQRQIGKYLIKDKHKNKTILKGHKNNMNALCVFWCN